MFARFILTFRVMLGIPSVKEVRFAFDRGLITISDDYEVMLSEQPNKGARLTNCQARELILSIHEPPLTRFFAAGVRTQRESCLTLVSRSNTLG